MRAKKFPYDSMKFPSSDNPSEHASASPKGVILGMVLTITLVIAATELLEFYFHSSEPVEGLMHILALSGIMGPLFYYFWFRPLTRQIALSRAYAAQIRNLNHRLIGASEAERNKLARDLHDEFGQKLTCLQLQIETLEQKITQGNLPTVDICGPFKSMVSELGNDLRNVLSDLRPAMLDGQGLGMALTTLCAEISADKSNFQIDFRSNGVKGPLHPEVEIALFRACQEALTNVVRHSGAHHVEICLTRSHPLIILTIQDDGIGVGNRLIDPATGRFSGQYGLIGMRERVAAVGGTFRIGSLPKGGTRIRIEVPESLLNGANSSGGESAAPECD